MADAPKSGGPAAQTQAAPKVAEKPRGNPAFRAMGLPNLKWKLPSRNWMIFITVVSSWTAAVMYDRREKKKAQKKWCDLVAHIAQQPLDQTQMARRIMVVISAPPGDGVRASREFFKQYVKPMLVAAAIDYDVIEGRKEGEVRYGIAEWIRRSRRMNGEPTVKSSDDDELWRLENLRRSRGVEMEAGARGDLVLGRHTWKEYVRGVHEGWLGPVDAPPDPKPEPEPFSVSTSVVHSTGEPSNDISAEKAGGDASTDQKSEGSEDEEKKKKDEKPAEEKKPPYPPPTYLPTSAYASASLAPSIPPTFEPSQPIHQYHLLGFLKTPIRIWNYLNQRHLADRTGRDTAALVLALSRPYSTSEQPTSFDIPADEASPSSNPTNDTTASAPSASEIAIVLAEDEPTWHKSTRKPRKEGDTTEPIWTTPVVLDRRISSRMRKFELDFDEAARAERIGKGEEKGRAVEVRDLRSQPVKVDYYEDD